MKILYVITGLDYGGAETQLLYLATEISKNHECLIVSLTEPKNIHTKFETAGIPIVSLGMIAGKPSLQAIWRLKKVISSFGPDVVHSHMIHANLLCRIVRLFHRFKLINTAHNVYEGGRFLEMLFTKTDFLCDLVTQVSPEGLARYREEGLVRTQKSQFVRNAVELNQYLNSKAQIRHCIRHQLGITDDIFVFSIVGRLEPVKDHLNLFQAIKKIKEKRFIVLVIGKGYLDAELKQVVREFGIDNHVKFLGLRTDVDKVILTSDCFVLSSKYEGLPIAILEAMAAGLPIVSTEVGAIPEVVENKRNGILVSKENSERLGEALSDMMCLDDKTRSVMGECSKERIKDHFASAVISKEWMSVYLSVCGHTGPVGK